MPDQRKDRIKELFQSAAQRPPSERRAYLDEQCGQDAALRSAVDSLLQAGEGANSLLDGRPPLSAVGRSPDPDSSSETLTVASPVGPAQVIDRYRLLERIGDGGMGEVWLAEQQEPVRRRVALKLIKAGMDTAQVMARFEAERQALALMDHPAIATVFDAGATPAGRPFFVMEHVAGLPITRHCDERLLGIAERLELFVQVCEGVQHAHQKSVLHRDLKPSNVLVTSHDGRATPKIIDFGVAKAMAQPLTAHTLHTGVGMLIGTPGYMSPEQADLGRQDVDTRTDVYSLGVMLYELLVGVLPLDEQSLRKAGWEGLGRLLRDQTPATPSRRLSTLPAVTSAESARRRQIDLQALRRRLSGDLDWIVMKAIEPDRERRYGGPSELAEEIRRHLRHEPVLAGSPSAAYRMRKFVRRHRLGVAVAAVLTFVVSAGLIGTTLGLLRARKAERDAKEQAATSERVSGFLSDVLASVNPERMGAALVTDLRLRLENAERARGGGPARAAATLAAFDAALRRINRVDAARSLVDQEILARAAHAIDEEMGSDPLLAARLQATLGTTYHELGLFAKAASFHLKAMETRRRLLGAEHPDTLRSTRDLGRAYYSGGRIADAEPVLQEAVDLQTRLLGPQHPETLESMNDLAYAKSFAGQPREAEQLYRSTLERRRRVLGAEHPDTTHTMRLLADLLTWQPGRAEEAERLYREALEIQRRVLGPEHHETLRTMGDMARADTALGRHEEAERLSLEVIDIRRRISGEDNIHTVLSLGYLGMGYAAQGRPKDAERVLTDALERSRRAEALLVTPMFGEALARLYRSQGRLSGAETLYREALEIRRQSGVQRTLPSALGPLADVIWRQGRREEAEQLFREALEIQIREFGPDDGNTLGLRRALASVYWRTPDSEKGREYVEAFLADLRRRAERPGATPSDKNEYAAGLLLADPADLRDPERALPFALDAVAATDRRDANILDTLALAYHLMGRGDDAVRTEREALVLLPAGPSPLREELERNMAMFQQAARRR